MRVSCILIGLLCSATSAALGAAETPLFPEDASAHVGRWYLSENNIHFRDSKRLAEIQKIAELHQFEIFSIPDAYEWLQDVTLFDELGGFVAQARYSLWNADSIWGLTSGVANEDGGLVRISEDRARQDFGVPASTMQSSFVEGGGLVTGRNKSGDPYALVTTDAVARARAFVMSRGQPDPGESGARLLVAQDLRVDPSRLYVLRSRGHLDLVLFALPGGKILLDDPSKVVATLSSLFSVASRSEQVKLNRMIRFYEKGHVNYYDAGAHGGLAGKPIGPARFPYDAHDLELLRSMEDLLSRDFEVIRVAGTFKDVEEGAWSFRDQINFFNGFQGRDTSAVHWVVTNEAAGLDILERYWSGVIREHSEAGELRVYFPGKYSSGAGIDCSGAPAP